METRSRGEVTWRGRVESELDSRANLTLKGGFVAGKIRIAEELYEIRPLRGRRHLIQQLDPGTFPGDLALPAGNPPEMENSLRAEPGGESLDSPAMSADGPNDLHVMVTYSPQARAAASGAAQIEAQIQSAVDSMDTAFIDSNMIARVTLVHTQEIARDDTGVMETDLDWVRNDSEVAALRDQYGADLVAHIVENGGPYCGIGYVQRNPGSGFAGWAFSVTDRGCLSNSTLAHELGHNLGFEHDPVNGTSPDNASYPWSFAHFLGGSFRTIMSYSNQCTDCPRKDYFSNPDIYYSANPLGIDGARDNARTGDLTASIVSDFRASVIEAPLTFAAIGDFGSGTQGETDVANLVSTLTPDLVITAGDNRYGSTTMEDVVGEYFCDFLTDVPSGSTCLGGNSPVNAFFPSTGNHDYDDGGGISEYLSYFTLPGAGINTSGTSGSELYYDFVDGPVHFFVLDSDGAIDNPTEMTAQQNWLQAGLASSITPWQVVYFHHAPYSSSSSHGSTSAMQWPFAAWGADAVITGHDHTYERIEREGIVYFVNGLGGMSKYNFGPAIPGSQFRYNAEYGVLLADATDSAITFQFINVSGTVVDSYTLSQSTTPNTVDVFIAQSSDDVEETTADGSMYMDSTDIELGDDPTHRGAQTEGLRFSNINIPQGATVDAAYIEFVTDEIGSDPTNVEIRAQAADNAAPFSTANYDLTSRTATSSSVAWDIPAWNAVGELHQTPELSAVIQEVVSRTGWQSGNSMAFVISGTGTRTAEAYDGDSALAALLHVEFNTDTPPPNAPPTADFGYACSDLDCDFTDQSSDSDGSVVGWQWDFGGDGSSTTRNPSHSFTSSGSFTVTLTVLDDDGDSDSTGDSVTVTAANTAPVADDDIATTNEDAPVVVQVLDGDTDADGDTLTVTAAGPATNGGVSHTTNSVTYIPNSNFNGFDSFTYSISDGNGGSDSATVTVTVNPINDPPVFSEDPILGGSAESGTAYSGSINGTASDVDSISLTYSEVGLPTWLVVAPDGTLSGTPSEGDVGTNFFTIQVNDGSGGTDQTTLQIEVTVPTPSVDQLATGQILTWGEVVGSYIDTHSNAGGIQSITEIATGGKKTSRTSQLRFDWTFNVEPGVAVTLFANAWAPISPEGDKFEMSYSTNGSSYSPMFQIQAVSDGSTYQSYALPASTSGTVYVRVADTDQTGGNYSKDTVFVDHLFISTDRDSVGTAPTAPVNLTATASSSSAIDLSWDDTSSDEHGFYVQESTGGGIWSVIETVGMNSTAYTATGLASNSTYSYRVRAYNGSGDSPFSNISSATTAVGLSPIHVESLDGSSSASKKWEATVTILIEDASSAPAPVSNVTVSGSWSAGGSGSCTTDVSGLCSITKGNLRNNLASVTFTVTNVTHAERSYDPSLNTATSIEVPKP